MSFKTHIFDRDGIADSKDWRLFVLMALLFLVGYLLTDVYEHLAIAVMLLSVAGLWTHFSYIVSSGTTSRIELVVKGHKRSFNFQLLSDEHLKDLKPILEQLYLKGIFVREFLLGNRTYLFEELNYEEIQEFKRKYGLTGS